MYFIRALANRVVHVNAGQVDALCRGLPVLPGQDFGDIRAGGVDGRAAERSTGKTGGRAEKTVDAVKGTEAAGSGATAGAVAGTEGTATIGAPAGKGNCRDWSKKQAELTAELEKPETYQQPGRAMEINRELIHVQERLAELTPEWETAASKLETIE